MQPTATFPTGNASEIFGGDVVKPSQWNEVVNGMVEVSDAPGLGLELDRDALPHGIVDGTHLYHEEGSATRNMSGMFIACPCKF